MSKRREEREVHGRTISFSSLEKVLYPDAGYTKGDVVDYYDRVAEVMLPHVRDRFISMHRWPDGIDGEGFYQKEMPDWFPEWVHCENVEKKGGMNCQVTVEEEATLVYLAQQACLTPHIWLSRVDRPDRPDRIVFDFDPSEQWEEAFDDVRRAARQLRDLLEEVGLKPRVMTSGSKGLHVHAPIERDGDFEAVKAFARDASALLAGRDPERLTTEVRKNKRRGRIFVDYLRNEWAQTAVAPYSLRARPGAPVATPLEWDELGRSGMSPRKYTLGNLFRRLSQRGDPWADIEDDAVPLAGAREKLDELMEGAETG